MSYDLVNKRAASGARLLGTEFQLSCWDNDNLFVPLFPHL